MSLPWLSKENLRIVLDTYQGERQVPSEWTAGKVGHFLAQQLRKAGPKAAHSGHARAMKSHTFCCDRGKEATGGNGAFQLPWLSPQLTSSAVARCGFLPFCSKDNLTPGTSLPLCHDSLVLSAGAEVRRLIGQWRLSFTSSVPFLAGGCSLPDQHAQRLGAYSAEFPFSPSGVCLESEL